jgi:hypothetical protein
MATGFASSFMLYDRLVGAFGMAVALLCLATMVAVLTGSFSAYVEPLKYACFLACMVPMFYMQSLAAQRDGLPADGDGVDIWPILKALPLWAACTSALLLLIMPLPLVLYLASSVLGPISAGVCIDADARAVQWFQGGCVLLIPKASMADMFFLSIPLNLSFLCGSYLLFRRQPYDK